CPHPSRIFHGRQRILDTIHGYFNQDAGKQHIFLLHGLGGAGKTQIALKFIQESSYFSDIFLVDASTSDTIDAGLENIAFMKSVGTTKEDGLKWLSCQPAEWLLFFDNADDPNIDLNQYLSKFSLGNILITSRNPGLCVYAGSHSLVSDMEESDAVHLLLISAAQNITPSNKEISIEIALWYFPLAIIQAGAFIAKTGDLSGYLQLYRGNRARLLKQKPGQSHDDYSWTVYTTWQISFDQLSPAAAMLLQLCSFIHHQGISEQIFSNASKYRLEDTGPTQEELRKPQEILSHFLGSDGSWDSLCFVDVRSELQAYSLINFNMETKLFSIHPLVHTWSQSTITDPKVFHYSMTAIAGMSIASMPSEARALASLWLLPHIDSLLQGGVHVTSDFSGYYGHIYHYSGRFKKAAELSVAVYKSRKENLGEDHLSTLIWMGNLATIYHKMGQLKEAERLDLVVLEKRKSVEKQKTILGEDHPYTLSTMGNLGTTYHRLGQFNEAEELQILVLQKHTKILGEEHPKTLIAMGNLASTYKELGQLKEAKKLEVVVLERRKQILGEDHPNTLLAMSNLADTYRKLGELNDAKELGILSLEKR
ncbi:P-loop containing nucleoside triphosphate hydrolase protein, partial [Mycena galopus ATCC 62051]